MYKKGAGIVLSFGETVNDDKVTESLVDKRQSDSQASWPCSNDQRASALRKRHGKINVRM